MTRRLLAGLGLWAAAFVLIGRADPQLQIEDAANQQQRLQRQFDDFKQALLRLAQRLEKSAAQQDKDKARKLRDAIKRAADEGVDTKFATLVDALRKADTYKDLEQLEKVLGQNKELCRDIRMLLDLLLQDDRGVWLRDEIERNGRLLQELNRLIVQQDRLHTQAVLDRSDTRNILEGQKKVTSGTRRLVDPKERPNNPVRKPIEAAGKHQKRAEDDLDAGRRADGAGEQEHAREKLEVAHERLETLLRQLRREEIERLLTNLEARCRRLHALQVAVRDCTLELDKVIQRKPDRKPTRGDTQNSLELSDKESEIVGEAGATLRLIEAEGSAVAFAEVFRQVHADMATVTNLLGKADTGAVTVRIENDVVDTLQEMIDALKKARDRVTIGLEKPRPGVATPQDPKLIDLAAELKMIRSMQQRVNARTEIYGKQYAGEQAPPPAGARDAAERETCERIQRELKDLAGRQQTIGKAARDVAAGKNETR